MILPSTTHSTAISTARIFTHSALICFILGAHLGCARHLNTADNNSLATLTSAELPLADADWQESVIESPRVASDLSVTNGVSFERAEFALSGVTELLVPEDAHVIEVSDSDVVTVEAVKGLQFLGVPPRPMRIVLARRYLGVATRRDSNRITLATYGEWQNTEGRASMRITVRVPATIQVLGGTALSGPQSLAQGATLSSGSRTVPAQLAECYWYGPIAPGTGWQMLTFRPDGAKARAKDGPLL